MSQTKTPAGRLREDGVLKIRKLRKEGATLQSIATTMNVSIGTVYNVVHRLTWGWLKTPDEAAPAKDGAQ